MKSLLMRLLSMLAGVATGVLAGIIGLAVIIWFAGRYVGLESVPARLMVIGGLFACYLLWLLGKFIFLRVRGTKLAEDLASGLEDDQLKQKLDDVLKALKSTDLGRRFRGKGALYALPWYMIIGPSAAGKSTFYSRSGLNFPFKDDERYHLSGIGGTKNCDWWFSDQAVLIDTAGRYSNDDDSSEWLHFLQLLKKNRPRVPVNGVVLALPIDELLTGDRETLKTHAQNTRNRLQEIMSELGLMVPVYIVLTKCDRVRGFDAFFEDLSDAEAAQPWGVYVLDQTEDRKADVVSIFRENIELLNARLLEQRSQKMMLAQSATQRADIYQYPSQFAGASDRLMDFIELLFKDSPYHERPWFAGVYFTSSVQEGDVIERKNSLIKDMFSKALGLTYRTTESNRSYFIADFFTKVIFPLKDAVRGNRSRQRFNLAAKSLAFTAMVTIIVAAALTLTGTYTANLKLLGDYEKKAKTLVERLNNSQSSESERLEALTGLYRHYQDLQQISTYSPLRLFNRYDLIGTHGEPMRHLLVSTLETNVEDRVIPQFQKDLLSISQQWASLPDAQRNEQRLRYYQYLESYLMLTSHPEQYNRDKVAQFIANVWFDSFPESDLSLVYEKDIPTLTQLASLYLQFSFESLSDDAGDQWLMETDIASLAQQHLVTPPNASQLYQQLIAGGAGKYADVNVGNLLGAKANTVFANKVSFNGIYTVEAWHGYVNDAIKQLSQAASQGDWVLGMESVHDDEQDVDELAAKLERSIRRLYFNDYSEHWLAFVTKMRAKPSADLVQNIQAVKEISDPDGLLTKLFSSVKKNLMVTEVEVTKLDPVSGTDQSEGVKSVAKLNPVIPTFAALNKDLAELLLDRDDSGQADLLERYLAEIQPLAEELDNIKVASDVDMEARRYAAGVLSGDSGNKRLYSAWINVDNLLNEQSEKSRALVSTLMTTPLRSVWSGMVAASERSLEAIWQENVYRAYNTSIRGRFPFTENGSDATVRDVSLFLKPTDGLLWSFVNNELKPFVQVRSGNWKVRTWLGEGLSFDQSLFTGVNSATNVVKGLFDDYDLVSMRYWVSPIPSPGVSESVLEVDDNAYRYRNEPEEWREFNWSLDSSQFAQVQVHLNSGGGYADISFDGPWAFLRLLGKSEISHRNGTQFDVTWPLELGDGRTVNAQYRVRADRAGSILNKKMLTSFYLPRKIFKG